MDSSVNSSSSPTNYLANGCPVHRKLPTDPVPMFANGNINFKAHDVGWIISACFTIIAIVVSAWLIVKHLSFFYAPHTQRHIVRILFLVPIYALTSFLSYFYYEQAISFQLGRDCYEAVVIAAFFFLLLAYLSTPVATFDEPFPTPYRTRAERTEALRTRVRDLHLKKWMWPFGFVKWRPARGGPGEGERFIWLMRIGIGQYVLIRPLSTLAAVVGQSIGWYCLASWSPKFVHIWSSLAITISVSIAMYCVLQLYMPLKNELAPFRPILQFLAVKSVVFLTFWQESALTLLVSFDVIKDKQYWSAEEIVIGLSALLSCFEMMCFAFLHIKAFSYLPYRALAINLDSAQEDELKRSAQNGDNAFEEDDLDHHPLTFSQWNTLDLNHETRIQAQRDLIARLQPLSSDLAKEKQLKADGSPLLRQTKKWPAFVKCVLISDLAREIKEEAVFVASKKARRAHLKDRVADLELAMGEKRRPTQRDPKRPNAEEGDEKEQDALLASRHEENFEAEPPLVIAQRHSSREGTRTDGHRADFFRPQSLYFEYRVANPDTHHIEYPSRSIFGQRSGQLTTGVASSGGPPRPRRLSMPTTLSAPIPSSELIEPDSSSSKSSTLNSQAAGSSSTGTAARSNCARSASPAGSCDTFGIPPPAHIQRASAPRRQISPSIALQLARFEFEAHSQAARTSTAELPVSGRKSSHRLSQQQGRRQMTGEVSNLAGIGAVGRNTGLPRGAARPVVDGHRGFIFEEV